MKRILIAGADSYIGGQFTRWLDRYTDAYETTTVDLIGDGWRSIGFSGYDAVFFVAGIAHRKERADDAPLYMRVNRDLPRAVAEKAKTEGVRQFVFLSSMSVYGRARGAIRKDTPPAPTTLYGKSKLEAEALLSALVAPEFCVSILRPPMVYGAGCRGNYPRLSRLARRLSFFPCCRNRRGILFVDHLCEAVRLIIDAVAPGVFFPQDAQCADTGELMRLIAGAHGRELQLISGFSWLTRLLGRLPGAPGKVFGDLYYEDALTSHPEGYRHFALAEAITKAEQEGAL